MVGCASVAVEGSDGVDQELKDQIHVMLIFYYQINIPRFKLKRQAVPRVKWKFVQVLSRYLVDMLSQHPESGGYTAKKDAIDFINMASGT